MKHSLAYITLHIVLSACSVSFLNAQAPDTVWTRTYGGTYVDACWSVQQTSDRGYILAGQTGSFGVQALDFYLVKTDSMGDTIWTCTYGGQYRDEAYSVAQTSDDGYIITGWSSSFAAGRYLWIVKVDSIGDTLWTRLYQQQGFSWGWSIQECYTLGTYIVSGHDYYETYLMKIDQDGDTLWTHKYGPGVLYSVQQTPDSGFIATGYRSFTDQLVLLRTNADGILLWERLYQQGAVNHGRSVRHTSDGGYIVAGYTGTYDDADVYLIRTDSTGDTLWTRLYGLTGRDYAYSVIQTSDGTFVVAGYTQSFGAGNYDIWVLKVDAAGDTLWAKTIGGPENDIAYSAVENQDGGYVVAGYTVSYGAGASDYYLVKLAPETGFVENVLTPVETSRCQATIIRGPAQLGNRQNCKILDITGRQIDTGDITAGIYFVEVDSRIVEKIVYIR